VRFHPRGRWNGQGWASQKTDKKADSSGKPRPRNDNVQNLFSGLLVSHPANNGHKSGAASGAPTTACERGKHRPCGDVRARIYLNYFRDTTLAAAAVGARTSYNPAIADCRYNNLRASG
jgi:hypothetical protein